MSGLVQYSKVEKFTCSLCLFQSDLKGLPAFFENQVLKRQTLAVHYIRKQLIRPQSTSSKDLSDDEEIGQTDDSNLDRKYSSNVEFEDEVPTSDFIDSC